MSAYIHIPFCSHKCDFCDFAAFAGLDHLAQEYCQVLQYEISQRLATKHKPVYPLETPSGQAREARKVQSTGPDGNASQEANKEASQTVPFVPAALNSTAPVLTSVFYGGGTPGLLAPELLRNVHGKLLEFCPAAKEMEVTLETTPQAVSREKAQDWLAMGINRISIGVESFQDGELQAIGRDHDRAQAFQGIKQALAAGFENVSLDLMYALPTQSVDSWQRSLDEVFRLSEEHRQINHFSAYGLHLATNSPLYSRFSKDSPQYPDDDSYTAMYEQLVESAGKAGFHQYEISNFCRPGFESRHNLGYWNGQQYYAFGVSAHRYVDGVRSSNWRSLSRYMKDPLGNETCEVIDEGKRISEAIMLGLRKRVGLSLSEFERNFGFKLEIRYSKQIEKLVQGGFLDLAGDHIVITQKGVPVSNSVIAELI
jgi:oxygen-independent coproporphyrinogen-3 oxidase